MKNYTALLKALQENNINELGILPFLIDREDLPKKSQPYYPFAVIESNLGMPKSELVQTMKEAHTLYITLSKYEVEKMENVTRIMIVLKPDNYTAMNRRKELIMSGHIDPKNELQLLQLIFTIPKHSKSSVAWYHRQWIVTNCGKLSVDNQIEMKICERAYTFYKRNYYAWSYRHWILSRQPSLVEKEYQYIIDWIELNISDSSGLQYLEQIVKMRKWTAALVDIHIKWLDNLIVKFPGYESLWYHKRFCSDIFFDMNSYLQHKFVMDIVQDEYKDQALCNENLVAQKQLALKFGLWLAILEKRHNQQSKINPFLIDSYRSIAPESNFLDRQNSDNKNKRPNTNLQLL